MKRVCVGGAADHYEKETGKRMERAKGGERDQREMYSVTEKWSKLIMRMQKNIHIQT